MRAQTSIEFLIIMAAVAGMSVAFIYAYAHAGNQVDSIYGYLNKTQQANAFPKIDNASLHAEIYAYMSQAISLDGSGTLEVIAALPRNSSSISITPYSSAFYFYPASISSNYTYSPYIAYFQAIPKYAGTWNLTVSAVIAADGTSIIKRAYASAYVQGIGTPSRNGTAGRAISASLSQGNDSVLYGLSHEAGVPKLGETSHCTYLNFWYTPLSFQSQCGNAAWDFSMFSDGCYDAGSTGRTYCVYENPTGYYTQNVTSQEGYSYNLALALKYGNATYMSSIGSSEQHAELLYGNALAGNVTVSGQAGQPVQSPSLFEVMDSAQSSYPVGIGAYDTYGQYFSSMEAKLGYYNGSGVGPSEFSSIQQSVSSYNAYLDSFLGTGAQKGCSVAYYKGIGYLSCPAAAPLDFGNITVDIYNSTINKSLSVDGSTINVR